jgi:hypothetical protein
MPSQFIRTYTFGGDQKACQAAASKLVIQINTKVGCCPWKV